MYFPPGFRGHFMKMALWIFLACIWLFWEFLGKSLRKTIFLSARVSKTAIECVFFLPKPSSFHENVSFPDSFTCVSNPYEGVGGDASFPCILVYHCVSPRVCHIMCLGVVDYGLSRDRVYFFWSRRCFIADPEPADHIIGAIHTPRSKSFFLPLLTCA